MDPTRWLLQAASDRAVITHRIDGIRRSVRGGPDLRGRRCLVTGGSSGIGRALAVLLGEHGASVLVVARSQDELKATCVEVEKAGGTAQFATCDLSDSTDVARLVRHLHDIDWIPDVLVNNAGHSIRRRAADAVHRFHDYERTARLNYLAPVELTLALLPAMIERKSGHIINVGTWGVPAGTMPRFTAYHASKAALTAFGRSLDAELASTGVCVTTVHYPLVRTPMIAPTEDYAAMPALTPEVAAEWILHAIETRPSTVEPIFARYTQLLSMIAPRKMNAIALSIGI
ncbi:SDR family NAD(P)-dependent oxidoreductase [Antrihabitans cavernicola]|uniref:SDR family NAD(P)-dependent oxidoreductase n=1 Tax=Antrihabitans cavernicola TaxID=2495913 RepID=A0A5A7SE95_9NOCA|nr:SDR family NAD(P)-dependent oxidoreductase [Spelaeibacter cavernicola]KAA0022845.1 SDR family NAD(P)-dependent oxidoreductase [Spelaeibacter cavernicola]